MTTTSTSLTTAGGKPVPIIITEQQLVQGVDMVLRGETAAFAAKNQEHEARLVLLETSRQLMIQLSNQNSELAAAVAALEASNRISQENQNTLEQAWSQTLDQTEAAINNLSTTIVTLETELAEARTKFLGHYHYLHGLGLTNPNMGAPIVPQKKQASSSEQVSSSSSRVAGVAFRPVVPSKAVVVAPTGRLPIASKRPSIPSLEDRCANLTKDLEKQNQTCLKIIEQTETLLKQLGTQLREEKRAATQHYHHYPAVLNPSGPPIFKA